MMLEKVTRQQIRTWINRQRTLGTPSPKYLEWLRSKYKIQCQAEVLVNKPQKERP
jgi:hypothetical protein